MTLPGLGQYDTEYSLSDCVWGTAPGKYVRLLSEHLQPGRVLDLGAGEGKNAIYLAELGHTVVAVECSAFACANFRKRLATLPDVVRARISLVEADVRDAPLPSGVDAVIAYGLLHCLPSEADARLVVGRMQEVTRSGGYNIIVTFTPDLPVPDAQSYLHPTFIASGVIRQWYDGWTILGLEDSVIEEQHPSTLSRHAHSLCRLLVRKERL